MEWLRDWQPDPFAKPPEDKPGQEEDLPEPDVVKMLRGYRLLSNSDLEEMYISETLGSLEGGHFKFKFGPNGWGQFPEIYLQKLLTYARARLALQKQQAFEAKKGRKIDKASFLSAEEKARREKEAQEITGDLARYMPPRVRKRK